MGAAKAICTTDTFPKLISRTFTLPSHPDTQYSIAGMTKGAGMIHPNMATLLSVICTDADVEPRALRSALRMATRKSFNSISVDGDTSTNDTVNIFANGAAKPAGIEQMWETDDPLSMKASNLLRQSEDLQAFCRVLTTFMEDLAKLVVRDGEGATKFVTIRVTGTHRDHHARSIAQSIARSSLVKTALYGKDANWGRILCAIGYSSASSTVVPDTTSVCFVPSDGSDELKLLTRGEPEDVQEDRAKEILEMEDLEILVNLNDTIPGADKAKGDTDVDAEGIAKKKRSKQDEPRHGQAVVWTCDLSHEYVTINGDYRT